MSKVSDVIAPYLAEKLAGKRANRGQWRMGTVGETGQFLNGVAFKPSDWGDDGIPIIRIQNLTDKSKPFNRTQREVETRYRVEHGDLLVSWSATLDAFIWDREPGFLNQHIFKVIPDERVVEKRFLFYLLKSAIQQMIASEHLHGSTMKHINRGPFLAFPVPIPPFKEQRRIVAEIEEQFSCLEAGVAALKRVQTKLKCYRAAVLAAACAGHLVPTEADLARVKGGSYETGDQLLTRIRQERRTLRADTYKESPSPNTDDLHGLPEGWVWASTGQLGEIIGGLTKNPKRDSLPRKLPYLRVANVYADELRLDEIEQIGVAESEFEKLRLESDDLLIVEGNGSLEQIGRVARWDGSINPCVHQNHLIKIRIPGMNPRWVLLWMLSSVGRRQIESVAASTSGLHTLSTGKVGRLPVPVPPLAEQHRIVAEVDRRLSFAREIEQQVKIDLVRAGRFRQATLRRALTEAPSQGIAYE